MKFDPITTTRSDTSLDREIEAMLSVEPTPQFVSRVRSRIAAAPPPGWNMGWTGLAAGSVVVAVVVAVVVSRPHEVVQPEALAPIARTSMQVDSPSDDLPIPSRVNSAKPPERHKPRVSRTAFREPQVLINPKEATALRHFLANPQPARTELSLVTIEPQPLPEFTFTPLPTFDPMAVLQGDFK
jgi:hypothetical protein